MDEKEHTASYKLTKYSWLYTIPQIHHYSPEHLKHKGFTGNYDAEGIRRLMMERLTVSGTILEIARHWAENHNPQLVNPKDSVDIYLIITEHLENVAKTLARNSNVGEVPMDDLYALAELQRDVFQVAVTFSPTIGQNKKRRFSSLKTKGFRPGVANMRGLDYHLKKKESEEEVDDTPVAPKLALKHNPVIEEINRYLDDNERDKRSVSGDDYV